MSRTFTIRETDVPDPLRVELVDFALPYARPHETAGFESGGDLAHKKRDIPGRPDAIYHVTNATEMDLVVNGAFRDFRMGQGYADATRKTLERIRHRANVLRVTWAGSARTCLLVRTKFGHEATGHTTYELTFSVGLGPDIAAPATAPTPRGDSDALARVRQDLQARRPPPVTDRGLLATLNRAMTAVEDGLQSAEDEVRRIEAQKDKVLLQVHRVTSLGAQVQQQVQYAAGLCAGVRAEAEGIAATATSVIDWHTWASSALSGLHDAKVTLRAMNAETRQRANAGTRLYRIRPGDTLEKIAATLLQDAGRANDLGLTARDLTPGRIVRVPAS